MINIRLDIMKIFIASLIFCFSFLASIEFDIDFSYNKITKYRHRPIYKQIKIDFYEGQEEIIYDNFDVKLIFKFVEIGEAVRIHIRIFDEDALVGDRNFVIYWGMQSSFTNPLSRGPRGNKPAFAVNVTAYRDLSMFVASSSKQNIA